MTIILGAYYMLKMYQQVMLGETKTFKDVNFEGFALVVIIAVLFFFGMYQNQLQT
jgi:NADH-quinone oxidoreductase subunit M